jgi:two-component system cell cycle response regulator
VGGDNKTMALEAPVLRNNSGGDSDAVLVQLYPPGPNLGRRFTLNGTEHVVGRLPDLDVSVEEDGVSRQHARLRKQVDHWSLEDLGSTNGSYVNDERITQKILRDGDMLRFGTAILRFLFGSNIEANYHEEIYKMSILDGLTGVHNKRYFLEFLEREMARARRHQSSLSLMMFDIDHFKKVNDTHGHLAGDAVLKELGRRLKPEVRREDLLARYGGEEFACVLVSTSLKRAIDFAEEMRQMVARDAFKTDTVTLPITVSIGVAELDANMRTPEDLIGKCDAHLYTAKRQGRNCVIG